jgi:hypothetical protein
VCQSTQASRFQSWSTEGIKDAKEEEDIKVNRDVKDQLLEHQGLLW